MQGRKYLDYDLESLHAFLSQEKQQARRVVVAFQDSEAFESGLLTDLIALFQYVMLPSRPTRATMADCG